MSNWCLIVHLILYSPWSILKLKTFGGFFSKRSTKYSSGNLHLLYFILIYSILVLRKYIYPLFVVVSHMCLKTIILQGRIQDFKLEGAHLKKILRAEGGAKILVVFRVKNHDFTPKNHIFSNFRGGGCAPGAPPPPWIRPCTGIYSSTEVYIISVISSRLYKTKAIEIDIKCHLHWNR